MTESSLFRANRESFQTRIASNGLVLSFAAVIISLKAGRFADLALSASSTYSATTSQSRLRAYLFSALTWAGMDRSFSACRSDDTRA